MTNNIWDTEHGAMFAASSFTALNTLYLLIEKGVITQQEAAGVMTQTATHVRDGSEDGSNPQIGEQIARKLETMAAWCLGHSPKI